jgi:hypothetical protein
MKSITITQSQYHLFANFEAKKVEDATPIELFDLIQTARGLMELTKDVEVYVERFGAERARFFSDRFKLGIARAYDVSLARLVQLAGR